LEDEIGQVPSNELLQEEQVIVVAGNVEEVLPRYDDGKGQ